MLGRTLAMVYGTVTYILFLAVFLYAIGFVGNWFVPQSIDSGQPGSLSTALLVNVALLTAFAVQHSVMARPAFKAWWTKFVPQPIERTTYVMITNILFAVLFWQWRPIPEAIWDFQHPVALLALQAISLLGWVIALISTFLIDHFDLFGLKRVYLYYKGSEPAKHSFHTPFFYSFVRHPLMLGFIIAFWATPTMTLGHLLFALMTTAYILVAVQIEERDLVKFHGDEYRRYQQNTSMLIPVPKKAPTD